MGAITRIFTNLELENLLEGHSHLHDQSMEVPLSFS